LEEAVMRNLSKNISMVFAAGCLGGLVNILAVWGFGDLGINAALGVRIAPALTPQWLYPRLIWGGIWGLLFLLPVMRSRILSRRIIFSLGPTIVQLFVVFPLKAGKGYMGLDLGTLTPLLVFIFNAIWGVATAIWLRWTSRL